MPEYCYPRCLVILILVLTFSSVEAREWSISADGMGDAPTIQAGIDSAASGDTVLVGPGRYLENLDFLGKPILVRGSGMSQTVLDGGGLQKPCVQFVSDEGRESILEGFEITNGRGFLRVSLHGGGIYMSNSEPTIRNNCIHSNSTQPDGQGGGIYGVGSDAVFSPLIESNEIKNNAAGLNGGGLGFLSRMAPIIRDNVISNNTTDRGDGAGVWLLITVGGAQISGNTIKLNVAGDHAGGILVVGQGTTNPLVMISNNLIANNVAYFNSVSGQPPTGGGVLATDAQVWINNNTFVGNEAVVGSGGSIGVYRGAGIVIERNILALTVAGGGIHCEVDDQAVIRDNLAWRNADGDGSGLCSGWTQSNANIVADPLFCDAEMAVYTLAVDSPGLTHPAGPLGAYPNPGCPPVPVVPTTWGRIKSMFVN